MLQGITNNLATYKPIFVTYDFAAQYMRATRTARLAAADYDPGSGKVTATLTGGSDLELQVSVFTGEDSSITSTPSKVPAFSGIATSVLSTPWSPRLSLSLTPSRTLVISWPNSASGLILQQNAGFQSTGWVSVTNTPVVAGNQLQVAIPNPASGRFYRLGKP
jgi:hypothetical protein